MKSRIAAVAFCACCTAMAAKGGNVCTWTGGGYNARWSNAANWDVLPASGNSTKGLDPSIEEVLYMIGG